MQQRVRRAASPVGQRERNDLRQGKILVCHAHEAPDRLLRRQQTAVGVWRDEEHRRFEQRIERRIVPAKAHRPVGRFPVLHVPVVANDAQILVACQLLQPVVLQERAVEQQVRADQRMRRQARIEHPATAERRAGKHAYIALPVPLLLVHAVQLHALDLARRQAGKQQVPGVRRGKPFRILHQKAQPQ